MTNVMSKEYTQLKMLGIKTVVYFSPEKFDDLEANFETCIHHRVKETEKPLLDFDALSTQLQGLISQKPSGAPIFMFCVSGTISGALAIKLTMDTNKTFMKELAATYIMQKRFELRDGIQPWLYV